MSEITEEGTVVRCTVTVEASIERAFEVFTEQYVSWAPSDHHLGQADLADVVIEPRVGGRWYEVGADGSQCDWGEVLVWDPPRQLALSWQINSLDGGPWQHDPDTSRASRIEVSFVAEGPGTTRVDLVHSQIDRHGEHWNRISEGVASADGWDLALGLYAKAF